MTDPDCVEFLQWALPRLHLRWAGFRKVRRQVCRRVNHRLQEVGLVSAPEYRTYLDTHPSEWPVLDALCRIFISRFYRDKKVFQYLEQAVLPQVARMAVAGGETMVRCWSLGCAAGEEPYTLALLWQLGLAPQFPGLGCRILATDIDRQAIERAQRGCYPPSSLKDLPEAWRAEAFLLTADGLCVKPRYRELVTFLEQDMRETGPDEQFHVILCRNVAFTYFDEEWQRATLLMIKAHLRPGGALVIGSLESLPDGVSGLEPWATNLRVYRLIISPAPRVD